MQPLQKNPENLFDALKPGQNEKSRIFQEIGIPKIHVRLFKNFRNRRGDVHVHIATQNVTVTFLFRPTHSPLKMSWQKNR